MAANLSMSASKLFTGRRWVWAYGLGDNGQVEISGPHATEEEAQEGAFHKFPGKFETVRLKTRRKSKAMEAATNLMERRGSAVAAAWIDPQEEAE